jgi:hypothetical protein
VLINKCNKFLEEGKTFEDFANNHQTALSGIYGGLFEVLMFKEVYTFKTPQYLTEPSNNDPNTIMIPPQPQFLTKPSSNDLSTMIPLDDVLFVNLYERLKQTIEICKDTKKLFLNNDFETVAKNIKGISDLKNDLFSFTKISNLLNDETKIVIFKNGNLQVDELEKKLVQYFGNKEKNNDSKSKLKSLKSFFTKTKENTGGMSMS